MSYIRNLTTKSRFFAKQRTFSHINRIENPLSSEKPNCFIQTRLYNVHTNQTNTLLSFRYPKWSQFRNEQITTRNDFLLVRNMCTTIPDVLTDKSMEIVSVSSPVVSEVAFAAANSLFPVAGLQYVIDGIHTFTGLNWWASIVVTTLVIRTLTLPSMINELRVATRFSILLKDHVEIKKKMNEKVNADELFEAMGRSMTESDVSLSKSYSWLFFRSTIVVSYYFAIQNMVEMVPSFQTGGASWFLDLTTVDSFYILPCLNTYAFWIHNEGYLPAGKIKTVTRFLVALSIPFVASFPQALLCHWITSNLFTLVYKQTMTLEPVRKFFDIPIIPPPPPPSRESEPESQSKSDSSD